MSFAEDSLVVRVTVLFTSTLLMMTGTVVGQNPDASCAPLPYNHLLIPFDGPPEDVAVADLNEDGMPDLVTVHGFNRLTILLGEGGGRFRKAFTYYTPSTVYSVQIGDLDNDGDLDVLSGTLRDDRFATLLVILQGNGSFSATEVELDDAQIRLFNFELADLNHDGLLDLTTSGDDRKLRILINNGRAFMTAPSTRIIDGDWGQGNILAADLNRDGCLDLASANARNEEIVILIGNCVGTFNSPEMFETGGSAGILAAGDFDGDGDIDLAAAGSGSTSILLNDGFGKFQLNSVLDIGASTSDIVAVELNNDGAVDLAWAESGILVPLINDGAGNFTPGESLQTSPGLLRRLAAADLNQDGFVDIAVVDHSRHVVGIYFNDHTGRFGQHAAEFDLGGNLDFVGITDADGDSRLDIFGYKRLPSSIVTISGNLGDAAANGQTRMGIDDVTGPYATGDLEATGERIWPG